MLFKPTKSQKDLKKFRTSSENIYFYAIYNFLSLSEFEQENCFKRMYSIYLSSIRGSSYEEFKSNLLNRKGAFKACIFIKEKQFNLDIGFAFEVIDQIYYKENDFSKENTYFCAWDLAVILPHFVGAGLSIELYKLGRIFLQGICQNCNIITFQRVSNPLMYVILFGVGLLVYPSPQESTYAEVDKMLRKMTKYYDSEGGTIEKPFVIKRPFRLIGEDKEAYRKMYSNQSKEFKYFVDQTDLQDDTLLVCINIERLVEGNTLNIPPHEFTEVGALQYEHRIFDPILSSLYKI